MKRQTIWNAALIALGGWSVGATAYAAPTYTVPITVDTEHVHHTFASGVTTDSYNCSLGNAIFRPDEYGYMSFESSVGFDVTQSGVDVVVDVGLGSCSPTHPMNAMYMTSALNNQTGMLPMFDSHSYFSFGDDGMVLQAAWTGSTGPFSFQGLSASYAFGAPASHSTFYLSTPCSCVVRLIKSSSSDVGALATPIASPSSGSDGGVDAGDGPDGGVDAGDGWDAGIDADVDGSRSGASALIDTVADDGTNCGARGGVVIYAGLDDGSGGGIAGDGILQTGERDATHAVCNGAAGPKGDDGENGQDGADGADGAAAPTLLTHLSEDAPTCPNGGAVLTIGHDDNANGTLDSAEIEATQALCNGEAGSGGCSVDASARGGKAFGLTGLCVALAMFARRRMRR